MDVSLHVGASGRDVSDDYNALALDCNIAPRLWYGLACMVGVVLTNSGGVLPIVQVHCQR